MVATVAERGYYCDGGGLWLQISAFDTKNWVFRFTLNGKTREMGLGPINTISLAEARQDAERCRKLLRDGVDPIEARKAERAKAALEVAQVWTFKACADSYIAAHEAGWRNVKHADQWRNTLATYAHPLLGPLPVQSVDTGLVMKVLEPVWTTKPETASRLRGRIESVLDWAAARKYRQGENPARWKGHLDKLLPARSKVQKVEHHPALPYDDIGAFMVALREQSSIGARTLEFTILTAARTGEVIGARWDEIDLKTALWTIPGDRMKAGRDHRVPISPAAMAVLEEMSKIRQPGGWVFPGARSGRPLSNMVLLQLLKRMDRGDLTAHGFRSTFRDWAAERTAYPREVAEAALAHVVGDKVEAAYRRGDLFDKRRRLMEDWAAFCARLLADTGSTVTPLRRAK
jgi:integrase